LVDFDRRPARIVGPVHGRGSAQPALFSRAEIEVVRGVAMPDEDADPSHAVLAPEVDRDTDGSSGRRYPWLAFGALVVFAATLLFLLY
jgi:hypothetical protein